MESSKDFIPAQEHATGRRSSAGAEGLSTFHKTEYLQSQAIPGSLYYFQDYRTSKEEEQYKDTLNGMLQPYQPEKRGLRYVAGHWPLIPLGTPAKIDLGKTRIINRHGKPVDWPNGKATFEVESGLVIVGDILLARRVMMDGREEENFPGVLVERADTDGGAPLLLGRVIGVTPRDPMMGATQTIEISCMPLSMWKLLAPGSVKLAIYVAYFPRIHPPTTGRIDPSISRVAVTIVNINPLDGSNRRVITNNEAWGAEQRIFDDRGLIPLGAYCLRA